MFLKSLEIHGFKSFADKTKLEFHQGVTGIVGPNGCGKSNIVDAMRWVLGETSAKALRGGEMADVIFNGTDRRSPLGMAEVTLTLSGCEGILDTEYDEVSLGRRVFRDGKGEYLINKQPCRLKDIHSLLMDTGIGRTSYSIMEQGKIDMLLSSKPEDRRAVFEEAAGITKYKSQKKEALRKLDYTEANLVRIRDIVSENERQIRSLSRQASKAKRYQTLHDDVKTLDLHLSHKQWRELLAEKSELNTSVRGLRLQQDELEDSIEKRQAQMAAARYEYQEIENRLGELNSQLAKLQNEVSSAHNRIEFNGERTHEQSMLIRKNEEENELTAGKVEQQKKDLESADRMLGEVVERIDSQEGVVEGHEEATRNARENRENLNKTLREIEEERSQLRSRIATLEATLETNERQLESDQQRLVSVTDELNRLTVDRDTRRKDADDFKERISGHQQSIEEFEETLAEMEQKYHRAKRSASDMQENLSELHKLHAEKHSRLEVLEQLIADGEGLEKGTQAVLKGLNDPEKFSPSVRDPLSSYLQVDQKFAEAIEAALGPQLQSVLVSDLEVAAEVLLALREDRLGEASLIAANSLLPLEAPPRDRVPLGAVAWAADKIQSKDEVRPLIDQLLENVLIAEDLETALRLREKSPGAAIATLHGEFISREGIIHGGSAGVESGSVLKRQAEIRELKEVTESLHTEVQSRQDRRDQLNNRVDQLEDTLHEARERLQQKRVSSSTLEGKLALIERDLNQLANKIESLQWEKTEIEERQSKIRASLDRNRQERDLSTRKLEELNLKTESVSADLTNARLHEETLTEEVTEARTTLAVERGTLQNLEEQRTPMAERLKELTDSVEQRTEEIETFRERIERSAKETAELQEKIVDCQSNIEERSMEAATIQEERGGYSERIEEGEEELTVKRREVQNVASQRGKEEVKIAQFDIKVENIEKSCRERYRTELEFFEPDSHTLLQVIEERKNNPTGRRRSVDTPESEPASNGEKASGDEETADNLEQADVDPAAPPLEAEANTDETVMEDPAEPDWEFVEDVVAQMRGKLDSMGPVNIDAISEFDELEEHYNFNQRQLDDLENSKEELLKMIARINRNTRKMFIDTFEQIRKNFRDMFKELFGEKAKADLVLLDDGDPLECGIDVIAKPPGKKLQSISLLSGGERSMTAVALLFGIYMVKPSPFCVLDELDAPLDETNINRFIKVLDRFIGDSQFVIVTHSKRTMSRADVMYGVSMEEFGVSKTVGVKFSRSDEAVGLKTAGVGG